VRVTGGVFRPIRARLEMRESYKLTGRMNQKPEHLSLIATTHLHTLTTTPATGLAHSTAQVTEG
jgi:hypothetical protein